MKEFFKRGMALLLALTMIFGMMPQLAMHVHAATLTDTKIGVTFTDNSGALGTFSGSASGTGITATANAQGTSFYANSGDGTIKLTNNRSYPIVLEFSYKITGSGSNAKVSGAISGNVGGSGSYSAEIAAGSSISIAVGSGEKSKNDTCTLTISNIVAKGKVTFGAAENGSYTVTTDSGEVSYVQYTNVVRTDDCGTVYTLLATPSENYEFKGWLHGTEIVYTDNPLTYTNQGNYSLTPVFAREDVTTTFGAVQGTGSYTVNDAAAPPDETAAYETQYKLAATPGTDYAFLHWKDSKGNVLSYDATFTYTARTDSTVFPVFVPSDSLQFGVGTATSSSYKDGFLGNSLTYYNVTTTKVFYDLNGAAQYAEANKLPYIVLMNSGTLPAGTYTIPSGVTLLIPFDDNNTLYTNMAVSTGDYVEPTAYRTLTLAEGAKLVINGAMSLSAKQKYAAGSGYGGGCPTGPVSFVQMAQNSSIEVNGSLYAYGYITGSGTVTANEGSKIYEMFQIMDFRGGTASTNMKNRVFPLSQYYVQNIEVPLTLHAGATEYAVTTIYMSSSAFTTSVAFIGKSGCMFNLTDGYVTKTYDGSTDRLILDSNGSFEVKSVDMAVGTQSINSSAYVLAMNSNMTINVENGHITLNQDLAMLPGVVLNIADGATCTIGEGFSVYVYDADQWGAYCHRDGDYKLQPVLYAPSKAYTRTEEDLVDAKITVAGKVDASKGYLYTTAGGANVSGSGTGEIIVNPNVPNSVTYQYAQSTDTYVEIPVTSVKLHNDNKTYEEYTATADDGAVTTYYWRSTCKIWHTSTADSTKHVNTVLDHDCDLCGGDVGVPCYDDPTDGNHLCDYCGTKASDCRDVDSDHVCENDSACDVYSTDGNEHKDDNKDHVCDYGCSVAFGTCEDKDLNHACDYGCDKVYGTCEDKDLDHACDYGCDKSYGTCEDKDLDHACDYGCDKSYGTCEDTNSDHKCDYGCNKEHGEHVDSDSDHACDYGCSVAFGTCEDKDLDHACDYGCDKVYGTCEDKDLDHACDYGCDKVYGTCEDTNSDHKCDYGCDKAYGTCEDKDLDHACDYGCDKVYGTCEDKDLDHACDYGCDKVYGTCEDKDLDHACDYGCDKVYGTCEDKDLDHACDYGCDKVYGTCEDKDLNHACDYGCDKVYGTCEDEDLDHACDYGCDKVYGTCEDEDLDHACDYGCDKVYGTCEDANTDHKCDYGCDKVYGICEDKDLDHVCDYGCNKYFGEHKDSAEDGDHVCDYGCNEILEKCEDCAWNYTDNEDGTHDAVCSICNKQMKDNEKHSYDTNGDCACKNASDAVIGDTHYYSLEDAAEAAKDGDVIILRGDVTVDQKITIEGKHVIIQGYQATTRSSTDVQVITTDVTDLFTVGEGGVLTLGTGLVVNSTNSILYANGGTINVDGAVLTSTGSVYAIALAENGGEINVKSGTIKAIGCTSVTVTASGGTVNISGGTVTSDSNSAVLAKNNGIVNIIGGEVSTTADEAYCAAFARNGVVNVTGGKVSAANGYGLVAVADGTVTVSGGTVNGGVLAHENAAANATISGGTVIGHVGVNNGASMTVEGGSFTMDVTKYCDADHHTVLSGEYYVYGKHTDCDWNYYDNEDGTHDAYCMGCRVQMLDDAKHVYDNGYCPCGNTAEAKIGNTYYYTFLEAVAAAQNGQTVTLLKNIELSQGVVLDGKKLTINAVSGATITTSVVDVFTVTSGGELTLGENLVVNSTNSILYANGGTINMDGAVLTATNSVNAVAFVDNGGEINVKSGTIKAIGCTSVTVTASGGTVNISGGTVTSDSNSAVLAKNKGTVNISGGEVSTTADEAYCAAFARNGVVNVTGGTVSSANGYGLVAVADGTVTVSGGTVNGGVLAHENAAANATISGGTVIGHVGVNNGASMTVTGGSFTMDVTNYCGYMYHTVKPEGGTYFEYGEHVYVQGHCACGHVQDLKVSLVVKAEGSDDAAKPVGTTKYGDDYQLTPDFTIFGNCYTLGDVYLTVGGVKLDASAYDFTDGVLTIDGDYVTGDIELIVIAVQRHTVGDVKMENYVAPSFDADGRYDLVVYCGVCGNVIKTTPGVIESSKMNAVAQIGNTKYESLDEAIAAANVDDTIVLLQQVAVEGKKVWDLTGITLLIPDVSGYGLIIRGDLTINGGIFNGHISVAANGKLSISGGSFSENVIHTDGGEHALADHLAAGYCLAEVDGRYTVAQHIAGEAVTENAVDATCTAKGSYDLVTYCVHCGEEMSRETVVVEMNAHTEGKVEFSWNVITNNGTAYWTCVDCGTSFDIETETTSVYVEGNCITRSQTIYTATAIHNNTVYTSTYIVNGAYGNHLAGEVKVENVVNATCTTEGSYENVTYCVHCNEELSRQKVSTPVIAHTEGKVEFSWNVITNNGTAYWTCVDCGTSFDIETETTSVYVEGNCITRSQKIYTATAIHNNTVYTSTYIVNGAYGDHLAGEVKVENVVNATCTTEGSYENVTYCVHCNEKLSRETVSVDKLAHTINKTGKENEKLPTCTEAGSYELVIYCACGAVMNRETVTVAALGHTAGEVVVENNKAPTCTEAGSYDEVTYCSVCDEELHSETITVVALGHQWVPHCAQPATCTEAGWEKNICSVCSEASDEIVIPATGHTMGAVVTENYKAPTCTEAGSHEMVVYCDDCDAEISRTPGTIPATGHKYVVTESAPTCTEKGIRTYTCACGDVQTEVIPSLGHRYEDVVTAPTCTETGYTTRTCSVCGDSYNTQYVNAKGHSYDKVVTDPTCSAKGYTTYTCSVCGDSYVGDYVDAKGHNYDSVVVDPTCTESGYTTHTCPVCNHSYKDSYVDAKGHVHETAVIKEATCVEAGLKEHKCTVCGTVESEEIPATGHSYEETVTAPTCTVMGNIMYHCSACDDTYMDIIPATGHSYEAVVTAPTCTEKGYTTYTCTVCGDSYVSDEVEMIEHSWENGVVTAPTCTEVGYTTYTCAVCGQTCKVDEVAATGHTIGKVVTENYKDPTCTEAGSYDVVVYCATCNDVICRVEGVIEATGHNYEAVVTAPTCTEDGYTTYTCDCGHSYKADEVEATGHSYEAVVTAPTCTEKGYTTHTCSVCGDSYVADEVAAKGHTEGETVKEYAEDGSYYDEVVYCTECGEELSRTKVEVVEDEYLLGDVNLDGVVDIMDANLVAAYYNERVEFTEAQIAAGDVNGDGAVDIMDANLIAAYYNERIDKFPAEE